MTQSRDALRLAAARVDRVDLDEVPLLVVRPKHLHTYGHERWLIPFDALLSLLAGSCCPQASKAIGYAAGKRRAWTLNPALPE